MSERTRDMAREYRCHPSFVARCWQDGMTEQQLRLVLGAFTDIGLRSWAEVITWAAITGKTPEHFIRVFASVIEQERAAWSGDEDVTR
jgi:hypothetical protein